jgi:N-acetylmuramoyl-L-alanine amidase
MMRTISHFLLLCAATLALSVALVGANPVAALHAQSPATATVLADRLNVRTGPGTGYAVVATAKSGEKYTVKGQSGSCAWLQITKGAKTLGWVSGNKAYVKLSGSCGSIPAAAGTGATGSRGTAAPAAGKSTQGCALLTNELAMDVKLSVKRTDGWTGAWSIPVGGQSTVCVDPGSYTATFTAAGMPGNMAFPLTVKGGEYYEIPLRLTGNP